MESNDCDGRYVIIASRWNEVEAYRDDAEVKYLQTGDVISKTYVPDWWTRSYTDYVAFVQCLQVLYAVNKIKAIRLVKALAPLGLKEAKDYTDDLCAPRR